MIVWIDMLRFDSAKAARKAQDIFNDDIRIRQFWDPKNRLGSAIGEGLGWEPNKPAWDIYLYYSPDVKWENLAPEPVAYFHQLSRLQSDGHFFTGENLVEKLGETTEELFQDASN